MNTDSRILSTYTRRPVAPFHPVPGSLLIEGAEALIPVYRDAAGEWARKVVARDALLAELRGPARPGHLARLALAADDAPTIWVRTVRPPGAIGFIDADGAFIVPMARLIKSRSCKYCKGTGSKKTRTGRTAACATCGGTGERRTTARRNPEVQCPSCFGRGYKVSYPKTGRLKIKTHHCDRCSGRGVIEKKAKKNPFSFDRPRQKKREAFGVRFRALDSVDAHRKLRRQYDAASFDVLGMKRIAPDKYEFKRARVR